MEKMPAHFCQNPFEIMEIHPDGDVYICCPNWNNFYSIGNIFKNTFEEVWNSDKAKELRSKILNNDYSLCDKTSCLYCRNMRFHKPRRKNSKKLFFFKKNDSYCTVHMKKGPVVIKLCYDPECNIACKMCRDKIIRLSEEELELYNSKIDSFFIPLLKDVRILEVNAHGDPFGSRHSRLLIEKVAKKYKRIKFDFQTNGILCTSDMFKKLGVSYNRINAIRISIHASTPETYSKIVPNGQVIFPQIIKNLEFLSEICLKYGIEFCVHFVVSSLNYKEIPDFIRLAIKYSAKPYFWELRTVQYLYESSDNDFVAESSHPLHEDLKRVLRQPICMRYKDNFSPRLVEIMMNKERIMYAN